MLAAQSGHQLIQSPKTTGHHNKLIQSPKTIRRPLQPKNQSSITATNLKPNPAEWARMDNSNKENLYHPPLKKDSFPMESLDVSLADELIAIREKLERLRIDREKNNKLLEERGFVMDLKLKEVVNRGEIQKQLEIEVDRLYRLKEIRLACTRISQIRSLRDKEQEKKMKRDMLNKEYTKDEGRDGQKDERLSHGETEIA